MMLQDIFPRKLDNSYKPDAKPASQDNVLMLVDRQVVAGIDGEITFPKVCEIIGESREPLIYLFSIDDESYFLLQSDDPMEHVQDGSGYALRNIKDLRESKVGPRYRVFASTIGKHLADWYRDFVYCGRCGKRMEHSDKERAKVCPICGYTAYPRIMPAVIVGVISGDRLLITKYRRGYNHSALVAGFTEIGETMEETVAREVMEEAGIHVKNIRYYKSQPWGIAGDILMGYYCDVDGDDTIHMDEGELKYAQWTRREDIVLQPDESSLTNEMMKRFKEGKNI